MSQKIHPSYFELDRAALGIATSVGLQEHLATCAGCRQHVAGARGDEPVPAWLADLDRRPKPSPRRAQPSRWSWFLVGTLATAAAATVLVARTQSTDPVAYTTIKGAPAVLVHIRRGPETFVWDGRAAVRAGDRLRLEIASEGYRRVAVYGIATRDGGERLETLYEGALDPAKPSMLPPAWQVDAEPGPEILLVVLGNEPVAPAAVRGGEAALRAQGYWLTRLRLAKENR